MTEVQSWVSQLWWPPVLMLLVAAVCIVTGVGQGFHALWLRQQRETPISDPAMASALKGVKPPPYAMYAAYWLTAGISLFALTVLLSR